MVGGSVERLQLIGGRKHLVACHVDEQSFRRSLAHSAQRRSLDARLVVVVVVEFTTSISTARPIGCQLHSADNLSAQLAGALRGRLRRFWLSPVRRQRFSPSARPSVNISNQTAIIIRPTAPQIRRSQRIYRTWAIWLFDVKALSLFSFPHVCCFSQQI